MSVFDFIIKVYQTRGYKIEFREAYNILDEIVSKRIKMVLLYYLIPNP